MQGHLHGHCADSGQWMTCNAIKALVISEECVQDFCRHDGMLAMVQVIVLEKGGFTPAAELALTEQEAFSNMYEMGSLLTTQDAGARRCLHAQCPVWLMLCSIVILAWSAFDHLSLRRQSPKSGLERRLHAASVCYPEVLTLPQERVKRPLQQH